MKRLVQVCVALCLAGAAGCGDSSSDVVVTVRVCGSGAIDSVELTLTDKDAAGAAGGDILTYPAQGKSLPLTLSMTFPSARNGHHVSVEAIATDSGSTVMTGSADLVVGAGRQVNVGCDQGGDGGVDASTVDVGGVDLPATMDMPLQDVPLMMDVSMPPDLARCTNDQTCQVLLGGGYVCESGVCVRGDCHVDPAPAGSCAGGSVCCHNPDLDANLCTPGSCCVDADCPTDNPYTCVANQCECGPGCVIVYDLPAGTSFPAGMAEGPDGAFYVAIPNGSTIVRVTKEGVVNAYPYTGMDIPRGGIVAGPDGNVWFTAYMTLNRITSDGTMTPFPASDSGGSGLALGADGKFYYSSWRNGFIGNQPPGGPEGPSLDIMGTQVSAMTQGSDGYIYYLATETGMNQIGRKNPTLGYNDLFLIPGSGLHPETSRLISDGAQTMWFTATETSMIGKFDMSTELVTQYPLPGGGRPQGIALAPDGSVWVAAGVGIQRFDPATAMFTTVAPDVQAVELVRGTDGNIWFAGYSMAGPAVGYVKP